MSADDRRSVLGRLVDRLSERDVEAVAGDEELQALRDLDSELTEPLREELRGAEGERLAAVVELVGLLCDPGSSPAVRSALEAWLESRPDLDAIEPLLGRDREVDLLLLEHLGSGSEPRAAALARRLADSSRRDVAKAARRALHRLRSRGIEVPEERRSADFSMAIEPDVRGESRAWRTGVDGAGARVLWVLTPSSTGGHRLLEAVVDDELGIRKAQRTRTSRKALREHLEGVRDNPSVLLGEAPVQRVAFVLDRGERLARRADVDVPAAYREWRSGPAAALFEDLPAEVRPSICRHLEPEAVAGRTDLLEASAELLGEPAFANWAHMGPGAAAAARKVREAEDSSLVLDEQQRKERIEAAVAGAAEEFGPELRRRYRERLESMASLLWEAGRREQARRALAAAVGFTEVDLLYERHPFARALIQRGVLVLYQRAREAGEEEESSRIIRP